MSGREKVAEIIADHAIDFQGVAAKEGESAAEWLADRVLAALEGEREGWQPIETAPRDGTVIMVARDMGAHGWSRGTAHWREALNGSVYGWVSRGNVGGSELGLAHPTHWMPLPRAPHTPQVAEKEEA